MSNPYNPAQFPPPQQPPTESKPIVKPDPRPGTSAVRGRAELLRLATPGATE